MKTKVVEERGAACLAKSATQFSKTTGSNSGERGDGEQVHSLKSWPEFFSAVISGEKNFELRIDDRAFAEGDILRLQEWDPATKQYSGKELTRRVAYLLRHRPEAGCAASFGLSPGYVILGLAASSGGTNTSGETAEQRSGSCPPPLPSGGWQPSEGIYVASRASLPERSAMWREMRDNGFPIISSWIDEAGEGKTADFTELWDRITREIASCDKLVLYAEQDDFPLKGAILEAGLALGMGKTVICCLPGVTLEGRTFRPLGSWIKHRNVIRCDNLHDAMAMAPLPDRAVRSLLPPVPAEWRVVPVKPTAEMIDALIDGGPRYGKGDKSFATTSEKYAAMLSAAPPPPLNFNASLAPSSGEASPEGRAAFRPGSKDV